MENAPNATDPNSKPSRGEEDERDILVDLPRKRPGKRGEKGEPPRSPVTRSPVTGYQGDRRARHQAEHDDEESLSCPLSRYLGVEVRHDGEQHHSHKEGQLPGAA